MIELNELLNFEDVIKERHNCINNLDSSIKKYALNKVSLEITRKCNLQCQHCMRGDAQNIIVTKEIIDKFYSEIDNVEETITLTGGEPTLALNEIEYFCQKLIESNWNTQRLLIITNGIISEENINRLVKILCDLSKKKNIVSILEVSNDDFHNNSNMNEIVDKIRNEIRKYNILCENINNNIDNIKGKICIGIKENIDSLLYIGNAKNNKNKINNNLWRYTPDMEYPHIIKINGNKINCSISILVNGNVSLLQDYEYNYADNTKLGNIIEKDFKTIIDDYNNNIAICDCWETFNYYNYKTLVDFVKLSNENIRNYLMLHYYRYQRPLQARKIARKEIPYINFQSVKKAFPILSKNGWMEMLISLYRKTYPNDILFNYYYPEIMIDRICPKLISMLDSSISLGWNKNYLKKDEKMVVECVKKYCYVL